MCRVKPGGLSQRLGKPHVLHDFDIEILHKILLLHTHSNIGMVNVFITSEICYFDNPVIIADECVRVGIVYFSLTTQTCCYIFPCISILGGRIAMR